MRRALLALILTLTAVRTGWQVEFTVDPKNVGVQLVTECKGKSGVLGFLAVDYVQVEPEESRLMTRRQTTPRGERCTVIAHVFRNPEGASGDPDQDYIGESSIIVEVQ